LALADITVHEVWGHDDYDDEFRKSIDTVFSDLGKAKRLLGD
jgi:hypothetical protein